LEATGARSRRRAAFGHTLGALPADTNVCLLGRRHDNRADTAECSPTTLHSQSCRAPLRVRPLVWRKRYRLRKEPPYVALKEVNTVFCESSRSFTDLLKLPRLHFSPFPFASRSIFGRNEVDLSQFETVLVLQHDASHSSPTLTLDNYKALIGPEPYLERVFCPVWMGTDFFETELSKECERFPNGLGEFLLRWRLHHLPSPF
jgi:hypothetical protein